MQNFGFFMMSSAFVISAMQRLLETRGSNDPEINRKRVTTAGFAGALSLMAVSFLFLSGGERMWSVFGPILGLGVFGLMAVTINTAVGGAEWLEKTPQRMMAWLEANEEFLGKYVFPYIALFAVVGVAIEAAHIFLRS